MISYKSCCWNREQHENWTLITKQYIPTPKILTWIFGTKPKQKVNNGRISQDVYSTGSKKKEWIFLKTSFQEASIFLRKISIREFDPGSGWTLAACLTHASRTKHGKGFPSGMKLPWLSGGRVSNAWVTCLIQGDNSQKWLLIPHKRTASHDAVWKTPVVWDGPASD